MVVETFFKGSHKSWAKELVSNLDEFEIDLLTDDSSTWKEAMLSSVENFKLSKSKKYDLVIVTSMVNLLKFKQKFKLDAPHVIYFHENQKAYPWTKNGKNNKQDTFINIQNTSAKIADALLFNSKFNLDSFCEGSNTFKKKAQILPVGLDIGILCKNKVNKNKELTILWNHRWEYDKNPATFFQELRKLKKTIDFKLIVTGESPPHVENQIFQKAKEEFKDNILHFGHVKSKDEYYRLLWQSHLAIVTSNHDFFGISICESTLCEVENLLPMKLAYPEHFKTHSNFYSSNEELTQKLNHFIQKPSLNKNHIIASYSWENIKKRYYNCFKQLIKDQKS